MWSAFVIFLPYLGAFLYLAIGTQTIRWRRKRRWRVKEAIAPKLAASTQALRDFEALAEEAALSALGEPAQELARLADKLALPSSCHRHLWWGTSIKHDPHDLVCFS